MLCANAYEEKAGEPYQLDEVGFGAGPCGKCHKCQLECDLVVEFLPSMNGTLNLIPSNEHWWKRLNWLDKGVILPTRFESAQCVLLKVCEQRN